ncbi:MAG TPA: hypothetical protein EYP59_01170 [Thiotrichaceae bacterium]|nr:hypothetical protein [Thiotrichaceae bacterium]
MLDKDRDDFTNILRGKSVQSADPEIAETAQAFRDVLLEWKKQEDLPPLRLPKEPITKTPSPTWQQRFVGKTLAMTPRWQQFAYVAILLVMVIPLFIQAPSWYNGEVPPSEDIEKSDDFVYNNISVLNPQEEAVKCYKALLAINIKVTTPKLDDDVWRLTFEWQPSQAEALAGILARYHKKLPPDIFSSATLGFKNDEIKTTQ